jgi:hypothetical protein
MNHAIWQAVTTELTIGGFARANHAGSGSEISEIPWNHFHNMVLSTAKMVDNTRAKQNGMSAMCQQYKSEPGQIPETSN